MNHTEKSYTDAARLVAGLSAIGHLLMGGSVETRQAYENLLDAATADEASKRERNLSENGWAYNEPPSPLIHPDYTDPDKRRAVVVSIACAEEADLEIETAGPFPMEVEDPDDEGATVTVHTEAELIQNFYDRYGRDVTTIRPMPFAISRQDNEYMDLDQDTEEKT